MTEEYINGPYPAQGEDGTVHLTYYDKEHELSFVWDGKAGCVEVSHGGHGEPVIDRIEVTDPEVITSHFFVIPSEPFSSFWALVQVYLERRWPETRQRLFAEQN